MKNGNWLYSDGLRVLTETNEFALRGCSYANQDQPDFTLQAS